MDGQRCSWLSEAGVVYWSEGLSGLGSGRLLARYFARMLEVYCGESEDMRHVYTLHSSPAPFRGLVLKEVVTKENTKIQPG